jgi:hypothetical protein
METLPRGRRTTWSVLLLMLALSQVLGGGCTWKFSSGDHDHDHDDDDDDDDGGGVIIITATEGDGTGRGGGTLPGDGSPDGEMPLPSAGPFVLVLRELPDADGDGVGELAILAVDGSRAELPAGAWLLSGADGSVLDERDLGALRSSSLGAPPPPHATATPAVPPSAPTTSARPAPAREPAERPAPRPE